MAIFHQTDPTGNKKGLSPAVIIVIILVVILCCCCAAVAIAFIATGGKLIQKITDLVNKNTYLPMYLTLRTWL